MSVSNFVRDAVLVQNACNLRGVLRSFSEGLKSLVESGHAESEAIKHKASLAFLMKIADLTWTRTTNVARYREEVGKLDLGSLSNFLQELDSREDVVSLSKEVYEHVCELGRHVPCMSDLHDHSATKLMVCRLLELAEYTDEKGYDAIMVCEAA